MNALTTIKPAPADDIRTFLPGISEAEYELRAKLRSLRNCASALIARTDSYAARALAWLCLDHAVSYIYAGATHEELNEIIRFCNRLIVTALQAEAIDDWAH